MNQIDVQTAFMEAVKQNRVPVTVFLINGFQIRGSVKGFDNFTVELESEGKQQMVYKHAISTIVPVKPVKLMAAQ
ncbi:RNA chaperone Hfq [Paenibacillus sp. TAF58]